MTTTILRIERGTADAEELAAVTAVLLARAAATPSGRQEAEPSRSAGWRDAGYGAPHSWRG